MTQKSDDSYDAANLCAKDQESRSSNGGKFEGVDFLPVRV
jgi:hypothetical protein